MEDAEKKDNSVKGILYKSYDIGCDHVVIDSEVMAEEFNELKDKLIDILSDLHKAKFLSEHWEKISDDGNCPSIEIGYAIQCLAVAVCDCKKSHDEYIKQISREEVRKNDNKREEQGLQLECWSKEGSRGPGKGLHGPQEEGQSDKEHP